MSGPLQSTSFVVGVDILVVEPIEKGPIQYLGLKRLRYIINCGARLVSSYQFCGVPAGL